MIDNNYSPKDLIIAELASALASFSDIEVFGDNKVGQKLSIYFEVGKGKLTLIQKVGYIDNLARILGNMKYYVAYEADISMWWMGNKGIDGWNEPFFCLDTLATSADELTQILIITHDIWETVHFALETNYFRSRANIDKKTILINYIRAFKIMTFIITLASIISVLKNFFFRFFTKLNYPHKKILSKNNNRVNRNSGQHILKILSSNQKIEGKINAKFLGTPNDEYGYGNN